MMNKEFALFLKALCNKKRAEIINLLMKGPRNVTEIYLELNFNQTTVSRHLGCLEQCGFVRVKRAGKYKIYSLNKETIEPLMKLIDRHTKKFCRRLGKCEVIK